ncbi:MAG: hypothetical protein AAF614_24000 [Chloroflexota bacterium]
MHTFLVIEPDNQFARALARTLKQLGPVTISTVATMREGCLILAQRTQDLIFMPVGEEAPALLRALRALQANVPIILTLPTINTPVLPMLIKQVQGILPQQEIEQKVPLLLNQIFAPNEATLATPQPNQAPVTSPSQIDKRALRQILTTMDLGRLIESVIVADGERILVSHGEHTGLELGRLAQQASRDWDEAHTARLQFMGLRPGKRDVTLYSTRLPSEHLLTLVASAEASLSELRLKAEGLTAVLASTLIGNPTPTAEPLSTPLSGQNRTTYNIAWRPRKHLPETYQIPLRRAIQRLAHENACILTTISIDPELVHLNINCPSSRGSDWIAFLLKNGSDEIIMKEFSLNESLWETGYYATESTKPLSENELNLFLETVNSEQ